MPIYEYTCGKCRAHIEVLQKITDKPLTRHAGCGGKLTKEWSQTSFQLKGSGWYVTDYAGRKQDGKEGKDAKDAKADSPETKDAKAESSKAESPKAESSSSGGAAPGGEKKKGGKKAAASNPPAGGGD